MKNILTQRHGLFFPGRHFLLSLVIPAFLFLIPTTKAFAESRVWISNPTNFQINYKLLFARSSQNFSIRPGLRNQHSSHEYPATFLVDLNVNLNGYPQVKRFRLTPGRSYYFHLTGTQLHLLKQPLTAPVFNHAPVTARVQVYALGGPNPVYHSSIILYNTSDPYINGREWSFWPQGNVTLGNIGYMAAGRVVNARPTRCGNPIKTFNLTTQHNAQMAAAIFNDVRNRWNRMPYRALDSNCNHFVNDVMKSLGAGRHPVQYQNSWGSRVPLPHVQSTLENHYGVSCAQRVTPSGVRVNNRSVLDRSEILRRVLNRIGL